MIVLCSYWVYESRHAVRCDQIATLNYPVVACSPRHVLSHVAAPPQPEPAPAARPSPTATYQSADVGASERCSLATPPRRISTQSRLWRAAVAPREHPAERAEDWPLAPAVFGATALDCAHTLDEPAYDSEEHVEPGQ